MAYIAEMARKSQVARTRIRRAATNVAPCRAARKRSASRAAASGDTPYHHGALHDALLEAAERVLEREGLAGLTLRAVAREAGGTHSAPTHPFGGLTGLVTELAAIGFRQFNATREAASATGAAGPRKGVGRAPPSSANSEARPRSCSMRV